MLEEGSTQVDSHEARIGRILSELHDRRARGESVQEDQLFEQHPDLAEVLKRHFATLLDLRRQDCTIDGLIRQGLLSRCDDPQFRARLGEYYIVDLLGRGGMGVVLKGYEATLRRHVALKLLRSDMTGDAVSVARFQREAHAAASLQHPNILTIYSVGEHDGVHFISMECIDGPTLADVIRGRGALPTHVIRALMMQLLCGLSAAHNTGLIHRDIKPANLLLNLTLPISDVEPTEPIVPSTIVNPESTVLKIADFGLARINSSQTKLTLPQQSFGTPQYMSPEQARGAEDIDHRTDLYSAGVVLYEMLTGRVPFKADTPSAVIYQVLTKEPLNPSSLEKSCDPAMASLALRLMAKRREDRFPSASAAIEALESCERTTLPHRRRLVLIRMACGAACVAACTVLWMLFGRGEPITGAEVVGKSVVLQQGLMRRAVRSVDFPEATGVRHAAVVDVDGQGDRVAMVCLQGLHKDASLLALNEDGTVRWGMKLTPSAEWLDTDSQHEWIPQQTIACDINDAPGDEVIVSASEPGDYPSRISIIDPRGGQGRIIATMWHPGDISAPGEGDGMWLEPDFFEDGSPALVIEAINNKLDGFDSGPHQDDPVFATWDTVSTVMILDPRSLLSQGECMAPPFLPAFGVELPPAKLHAYAYLDLSHSDRENPGRISRGLPIAPGARDQGGFSIRKYFANVNESQRPWIAVDAVRKGKPRWQAILLVDRNLNLRDVRNMDEVTAGKTAEEWEPLWKVIVREGEYILPAQAAPETQPARAVE